MCELILKSVSCTCTSRRNSLTSKLSKRLKFCCLRLLFLCKLCWLIFRCRCINDNLLLLMYWYSSRRVAFFALFRFARAMFSFFRRFVCFVLCVVDVCVFVFGVGKDVVCCDLSDVVLLLLLLDVNFW